MTFGTGTQARHYRFDQVFPEQATQEHVGKINFDKNDIGRLLNKSLIIAYG